MTEPASRGAVAVTTDAVASSPITRALGGAGVMLTEEERLLTSTQQMLALPKSRVALWLHWSRLPDGLSRPHHRRVAHAILETAAQHHDGELFSLKSGDMVLLCRAPAHNGVEPAAHPAALPYTLSRLFNPPLLDAAELTQTWWLEHDGATLLAHVAQLVGPR